MVYQPKACFVFEVGMGFCGIHGEYNEVVSNGVCPQCDFREQIERSIEANKPVERIGWIRRLWILLLNSFVR